MGITRLAIRQRRFALPNESALSCEPQRLPGSIEAPKLQCKHYHGSIGTRCGLVSCSAKGPSALILGMSLSPSGSLPFYADADSLGSPLVAIMEEDISSATRVARHKVIGGRRERDEAAIGAKRRVATIALDFHPG